MNSELIIGTTIGVILGGIITWVVSRFYYRKAGKELLSESQKLRLTSELIMYKLQYPDTPTQIKRNENGVIVGLIANMSTKSRPEISTEDLSKGKL